MQYYIRLYCLFSMLGDMNVRLCVDNVPNLQLSKDLINLVFKKVNTHKYIHDQERIKVQGQVFNTFKW